MMQALSSGRGRAAPIGPDNLVRRKLARSGGTGRSAFREEVPEVVLTFGEEPVEPRCVRLCSSEVSVFAEHMSEE